MNIAKNKPSMIFFLSYFLYRPHLIFVLGDTFNKNEHQGSSMGTKGGR